jgi:hypothetical protein
MKKLQLVLSTIAVFATLAAVWMGGAAGWPRCC